MHVRRLLVSMVSVFALGAGAVGCVAGEDDEEEETQDLADGLERMKDYCSGDVIISRRYDGAILEDGAILLSRDARPGSDPPSFQWSNPFEVTPSRDGFIRWWCKSTKGNWLDPGTWRVEKLSLGVKAKEQDDGSYEEKFKVDVKLGSSAQKGWTPERSRCDNKSGRLRARLGKDNRLRIECLPRVAVSSQGLNANACARAVEGQLSQADATRLCKGVEDSREAAICFVAAAAGGLGKADAVDLCAGSKDAVSRITCWQGRRATSGPREAVAACASAATRASL
ncbi:MAG: hypothetical protein KF782_27735 [Labilithrix sp.]|nr:hypothetical protein [Labilithrix sp.]